MEKNYEIANLFKVLADENRLKIIEALSLQCTSVNEISELAGISQPLASHHLKVLKEAGIARLKKQGTYNYY